MSRIDFSAGSFLLMKFCLIFVPFSHYDEPEFRLMNHLNVSQKH